jgi:hypothetical protein
VRSFTIELNRGKNRGVLSCVQFYWGLYEVYVTIIIDCFLIDIDFGGILSLVRLSQLFVFFITQQQVTQFILQNRDVTRKGKSHHPVSTHVGIGTTAQPIQTILTECLLEFNL